jgi:hypothetical protein
MYAIKRFFISLFIIASFGAHPAVADSSKRIGDWKVIKGKFEGNEFCYAYTTPFRTKAYDGENRNTPYLLIANKGKNQLSFGLNSGFIIQADQGVTFGVNGKERLLDIKLNENAWTYSEIQDTEIINDMIEDGISIQVRSYDMKDDTAVDYYSLNGIKHVLKHLDTNCQEIQISSKQ